MESKRPHIFMWLSVLYSLISLLLLVYACRMPVDKSGVIQFGWPVFGLALSIFVALALGNFSVDGQSRISARYCMASFTGELILMVLTAILLHFSPGYIAALLLIRGTSYAEWHEELWRAERLHSINS